MKVGQSVFKFVGHNKYSEKQLELELVGGFKGIEIELFLTTR